MTKPGTPLLILLVTLIVTLGLGAMVMRWNTNPLPAASSQHAATTSPATRPASENTAQRNDAALLLYCAANMKNAVTQVAREYEKEFGRRVELQFGGSGTLLSNIRLTQVGDLFIAADESYTDIAKKENLIDETIPLAVQKPVIAVKKGNPKNIRGLSDVVRDDVAMGLANPEAASIGAVTKQMLSKSEDWDRVSAAARTRGVFKPTVNDIAGDVKIGTIDAAIVWDATVRQPEFRDALDAVEIDNADAFKVRVTVSVLRNSTHPVQALHFARYLNAKDRGAPVFTKLGFAPVEADEWSERPQVLLFSGAVNRVAIQDTLKAFEQREGAEITTVYNGCGILNGQLKMGEKPDAYMTCDGSFMRGVESGYLSEISVSRTDIVIATRKGNPHSIKTVKDLVRDGLKIGVANERQSTLGTLTVVMLDDMGIKDDLMKNVVVQTPTADLLVTQIRAGALDAAIVYRATTVKSGDELVVLPIDHPGAKAVQTVAIARGTKYPQLVSRLIASIRSAESGKRFSGAGFEFLTEAPAK